MKNKFLFRILYSLFLLPAFANAAVSVFLDPAVISVNPRDTFTADIRIDTGGECVNAISGKIKFDPNVLKAVDFGRGQSLISLWLDPPKIDQSAGVISFSGGIPGGYCGRISGDPGLTNTLGKIVFMPAEGITAPAATRIAIADDSEILLNDGLGTKAEVEYKGTDIAIGTGIGVTNAWLDEVRSDTTAPELFTIELDREPLAYDGKYFIAWSTTDKQSGIDHYEVLETNPWKFGFFNFLGIGEKKAFWTRAESPHVLLDQNLRSRILVKAVDKIGNERIAELEPETSLLREAGAGRALILVAALSLLLVFAIIMWRMRKKGTANF
jgi:hypothetical protein